ncbi:MAG TPA: ABC transporter substrate-binding protein [Acidimicrobiales bacterium]|nr:ABC transporter substrate-binding protein [Acidimicrobiales bacterium]
MSQNGADAVERRPRIAVLWRKHRARWTLPLVIILIIGLVAIIDHLGSHRISQVVKPTPSPLVAATGGTAIVDLDRAWNGFNPNTPAGAASSTPTLLTSVLPSAYIINPKLVPQVNSDLLLSVEVTSTSPLIIQYTINPKAVWSDGVPVSADDFIYAFESQRGDGVDVNGQPDRVASTLGYRDVASVLPSNGGKTVTVKFATPFTDWRVMFNHMVPAHVARRVGWTHGFDTFNPSTDLSAGPFIVRSVSSGGSAELVRNPKWWGTPALLDRATVNVAPNEPAWTGTLAASNLAVAQPTRFNLRALGVVSSMPNTQSVLKPTLSLLALEFNVKSAVTSRLATRQAIAHAIDRTGLLAHTFGSVDPDLVVNQDHLATATQASYNPSSASAGYSSRDLVTTGQLLKSVGFHQDALGNYVNVDGAPLTVRMAVQTGDPWIGAVAAQISEQLHSAGISVVTSPVDGTAGLTTAPTADRYDMALVTRVSSPFQTATADWYSDGSGAGGSTGSQDWSNFDDPQVDQDFTLASQALNPVSGAAIYAQIDDQLWDQMVGLPLFGEPAFLGNGVQIQNVQFNASTDGILWNLPLWTTLKPGPPSQQT